MRRFITCMLLLLGSPACAHPVFGQDYNYVHYTTRDGLAGETLYTIIQDAEGFMWFATETGLSRFDGQKFRSFTVADGLPANEVFGFYEDTQRRLWIKSFSNEPCYYFKGKIHNKFNTPALKAMIMTAQIHAIMETTQGDVVLSDENGIIFVMEKSGTVRKYQKGKLLIPVDALLSGQDIDGHLITLPPAERAVLNQHYSANRYFGNTIVIGDSGKFIQVNRFPLENRESWLYYNNYGQAKLIVRPERLQGFVLPDGNILEAYRRGGAGLYDMKKARQTAFFLPGIIINGIYQDKDKNVWFGTKWNGLFKLSNKNILGIKLNAGNSSPAVQFVHAANGKIYAGDDNGVLWKLSKAVAIQGDIQIRYTKKQLFKTILWLKENAIGRCINYNGSDFLHLKYKGISQGVKTLNLSGDTLLITASDGVYIGNILRPERLKRIHSGRAICAMKFNDRYYVGTLHGLLVYDMNGRLLRKPLVNRISFLAIGKDGLLWVSTLDKGVYGLLDDHIVTSINMLNSALSSDLCRCIFYKNDNLWVGTDRGVCRINLKDTAHKDATIYNQNNGLSSDVINTIFVDDTTVYAGTSAGLNIFPIEAAASDTNFKLAFTQILVSDTVADLDQQLSLPHSNNSIIFDFSAISFATDKIIYQYRLTGLSDQWQKTSEQTLSFISLPSGKYRLQIQAFSASGAKSGVIEKSFYVKQNVAEYWWVRLLLALIGCAGVCSLVYLRIGKIKRAEAEKINMGRRVIELEQMALRAQMNPHFIFNCLNSVQHYILKQDAAGANLYLTQFAGLVRQTLENASKLLITLQEEITYLKHYIELERLQVNYPFEYTINVDPTVVTSGLLVPNMIVQPFIENALKHGLGKRNTGGRLTINIQKTDSLLQWIITDNGPGINSVKGTNKSTHQSRGISLIEKRINTLNSLRPDLPKITFKISDLNDADVQGTRVHVIIPVIDNSTANNQNN